MNSNVQTEGLLVGQRFSICWKAILAGVIVSVSIQVALSVLGAAFGFASVKPLEQQNPIAGLSHFAAYWWVLSGLISIAVGSFVAGHFSSTSCEHDGEGIGLVTWSTINLLCVLALLLTAGSAFEAGGRFIGGTMSLVMPAASSATISASEKFKDFLPDNLKQIDTSASRSELDLLVKGNSRNDKGLTEAFDQAFNQNGSVDIASSKDTLANIITSRSGVSHEDALASINRWQSSYDIAKAQYEAAKAQAETKAREAGEKAARVSATASFVIFVTLMLGLTTAILAARAGVYYRNNRLTFLMWG